MLLWLDGCIADTSANGRCLELGNYAGVVILARLDGTQEGAHSQVGVPLHSQLWGREVESLAHAAVGDAPQVRYEPLALGCVHALILGQSAEKVVIQPGLVRLNLLLRRVAVLLLTGLLRFSGWRCLLLQLRKLAEVSMVLLFE